MTSTFVKIWAFRNGFFMKGEFALCRDDVVTIVVRTEIPYSPVIYPELITPITWSSESNMMTWRVDKPLNEIRNSKIIPQGNIFFQLAEKLGSGKLILHTVGIVRLGQYWHLKHTEIEVQYYVTEEGGFFSPSIRNQRDLYEKLIGIIRNDKDITPISDYREVPPERDTIVWWDVFRLIGCIDTAEGNAMFHLNDIKGNVDQIKPGVKVVYDLEPSSRSFASKAKNVRVLS